MHLTAGQATAGLTAHRQQPSSSKRVAGNDGYIHEHEADLGVLQSAVFVGADTREVPGGSCLCMCPLCRLMVQVLTL